MNSLNILQKIKESAIIDNPYPHFYIDNPISWDLYNELQAEFIDPLKKSAQIFLGANYILNHMSGIWKEFTEYHTSEEFFRFATNLFKKQIEKYYPGLSERLLNYGIKYRGKEEKEIKNITECQFQSTDTTFTFDIHTDNKLELYNLLWYFPNTEEKGIGGDFEIYKSNKSLLDTRDISSKEIKLIKTIEYKPNRLVCFLNTAYSVHGVSKRINPTHNRMAVNIMSMIQRRILYPKIKRKK